MSDDIGKKAEHKIREWLDRPEQGYCFDRIPDQMNGFYGSCNICDFLLYKYPTLYYIESKATYGERFDFARISEYQMTHMLAKSNIAHVEAVVVVLFATYKRAFLLRIKDIAESVSQGHKSINITKIDKWIIPYSEIRTVPNSRKSLLDYEGEIEEYVLS